MSRAYRITLRESLSRHLQAEDGITSRIELLPVLPKERMRELLAAELAERGFRREGAQARREQDGGVRVEVDLDTGELSVVAEGHEAASVTVDRQALWDPELQASPEEATRERLRAEAQRTLDHREAQLRQEVTRRLEGTLRELKEELDGVSTRVTVAALKQRAAELGEVQEVREDAGGLTIKVRV